MKFNLEISDADVALGKKFLWVLAAGAGFHVAISLVQKYKRQKHRSQYKKDVVIFHQFGRGKTTPSLSPFPLKLETYFRIHKIPYENDFTEPMGPKNKCPWITFNGEDVADSELIIEYLNEKFNIDLDFHLSPTEKAISKAFQILAEEHLYWVLVMERYAFDKDFKFVNLFDINIFIKLLIKYTLPNYMKKQAYMQGIGRHTMEEVRDIGMKDLRALSTFLGKKKYFMGDKLCQADLAIFGSLVQFIWNIPGSPFEDAINGAEFENLKNFCLHIKEQFWPDWDTLERS